MIAQARFKAELEPLRLAPNWVMAAVVLTCQVAAVEYATYLALQRWGERAARRAFLWGVQHRTGSGAPRRQASSSRS